MLTIVRGDLGTGKTLLLAHYGDKETIVPVYTNFNLNVAKFVKKITPFDIEGLYEGLVLLQGFYTWLDCRLSGSELNRYLSRDFVFNSRKRGLNIIVDFQVEDSIDKRFMKLTGLEIESHGLNFYNSGYVYTYNYKHRGKIIKSRDKVLPYNRAKFLYDIYNTKEPERTYTPSVYEPKRLNAYINKVVKILQKHFDSDLHKITKPLINDILLENGRSVPSKKIIDLIYTRLKRLAV